MKMISIARFSAAILFCSAVMLSAETGFAQPASPAAPAPAPAQAKKGAYWEKQPEMKAALESLRSAMQSLKKASADKGGFRLKAMKNTREAIKDVVAGIRFDNKNLSADEKKDMEDELKKVEADAADVK
jgi:hypothetical protein